MSNIVEKLRGVPGLFHLDGCVTSQVKAAQKALGLEFPAEYIEYVKAFGAVSFCGCEWCGLNAEGYLNAVTATKQEREMDESFPDDCIVIENHGIEGLLTIMDEKEAIYSYHHGVKTLLCNTLSEYLDVCLDKNK